MSFASKHNRNKSINWGIATDEFKFEKLSSIEPSTIYRVYGVFTTPDIGYGEGCCVILSDRYVSLPARYMEDVQDILSDPESIEAIKAGRVGITYHMYKSEKYNRDAYSIQWVDI